MLDLTFGEQVKIILKRRGMTIKELAEIIGERTGKKMSRQNLTQRLGRDNFQEQDMRMIAEILGCPFHLNILDEGIPSEKNYIKAEEHQEAKVQEEAMASAAVAAERADSVKPALERDITIGELVDIHEELDAMLEEEAAAELYVEEETPAEEPYVEEEMPAEELYVEEEAPAAVSYEEEMAGEAYEEPESYIEEAAAEADEVEEPLEEELSAEKVSVEEQSVEEPAKEMSAMPAREERREKKHSWRDYLPLRKKKAEERPAGAEQVKPLMTEETVGEEVVNEETQHEEPVYEEIQYEEPKVEEQASEESGYEALAQEYVQEPEEEEDLEKGDVNPYTGREYESNSVRMHPTRIGYVQVYDRGSHQWTDMTEWAFLGYQERKKALLGKDYEPPIYLD